MNEIDLGREILPLGESQSQTQGQSMQNCVFTLSPIRSCSGYGSSNDTERGLYREYLQRKELGDSETIRGKAGTSAHGRVSQPSETRALQRGSTKPGPSGYSKHIRESREQRQSQGERELALLAKITGSKQAFANYFPRKQGSVGTL